MYHEKILLHFLMALFPLVSLAQGNPSLIFADTVYVYPIQQNDTLKKKASHRYFHLYDKQNHIREILCEKWQNNQWQYTYRWIFSYNAFQALQSYRKEIWDSTRKEWIKYKRRTFNYNIRYLPTELSEEVWDLQEKRFVKNAITRILYNTAQQPIEITYKKFKKNKWLDSLKKEFLYDTLFKQIVGIFIKPNPEWVNLPFGFVEIKKDKNIWYFYFKNSPKEKLNYKMQRKILFTDENAQKYLGEKWQIYVGSKEQFQDVSGIKSWYNSKQNQWIFTSYQLEGNKVQILQQQVLYPTRIPTKPFWQNVSFLLELTENFYE